MLQLRHIEKFHVGKFQKQYVLQDVNLDIQAGQFVSIMGPSGAGKSTLLNVLGMLEEPSGGEYLFLDEPVHKLSERRRNELHKQYIGFVFQAYHLIEDLTVAENIETPLLYRGVKGGERAALVADMLDRFGIVGKKDLFPAQLSGGQQQLVGIARAIVGKPKLLLADEPTGNLHSDQAREILSLFQRLNREDGVTIVQVTHSEDNARFGQRIVRLFDGRVTSDEATPTSAPVQAKA